MENVAVEVPRAESCMIGEIVGTGNFESYEVDMEPAGGQIRGETHRSGGVEQLSLEQID